MLYLGAEIASGAPAVCWLLFSVAAAAGFWTSPTMLYSYLIASIWLLWAGGSIQLRPIVISGLLTAIVVIFLYMPVFVVSGPQSVFHNPWVQPLPVQEFRAEASRFPDELVKFLHGADPLLLPIVVGLGVLVGILFRSRVTRYRGHLFVVAVIVVLAVSLGNRIVPFPRVLLPVYIAYYLSSAFGLSILTDEIFSRYELPALAALMSLLCVVAFHMTRSGYIEAHRQFPESRAVAAYLISQLRPCDRLIFSLSTEPEVKWQLRHDNISYHDYSKDEKTPERVLMTAQELTVLPPRGNGLLDPSLLTLEGTLRASGLNTADYLSAELVYKIGRGEVFKLTPRHPSDGCHAH